MTHYLFIIIGAVLVNNVVLVKILGLCPFMGVSKKLETAFGMGAATTFVLTVATGASYVIDHYLLMPFGLEYLRTLSFIVTIAAIVQMTEMVIQKTSPVLHQVLGIYLPLITTNCAVLGVPLLNIANKHNFVESLLFGAASAIGFSLVLILFAGIRERVEGADVPIYFKGVAIAMVHRRPDVARLHGLRWPGQVPIMLAAILIMALGAVVLGAALGYASIKFKVEGNPLVRKDRSHPAADTVRPVRAFPAANRMPKPSRKAKSTSICARPAARKACASSPICSAARSSRSTRKRSQSKWRSSTRRHASVARLCIQACPVDAIVGAAKQMHTIVASLCTGCELCVKPCPVECITMEVIPESIDNWKWKYPVIEIKPVKRAA